MPVPATKSSEHLQSAISSESKDRKRVVQNHQKADHQIIAGKYELLNEIGHGAQGRVYAAKNLATGETVVVKRLNIESIKTWKEYELFHREADVLRTLHIDGIARFYDAIECLDDNPPCSYIVREYIEGSSLQKMIDDGYRFTVDSVYDILIQTLQILDELHHHDPPVIHRDIKPSNLMISSQGGKFKVTIIDFGAVANPQLQSGGSTVAGTYGYMPPEQLMGNPVTASDIYSLAALAVQLFSGISPADIQVKDFRLIFEPLMQDKPHALVTLLRQMLEPKVENRIADIPAIIENLQHLRNGEKDEAILPPDASGYDKKYQHQLAEVQSICEPGTVDLWQKLPDNPRRQVPEKYMDYYNLFCNPPKTVFQKLQYAFRIAMIAGWSVVCAALVYVIPLLLLIYLEANSNVLVFGYIAWIWGIAGLYVALNYGNHKCKNRIKTLKIDNYAIKNAVRLIANSRKGIATITNITYLPVSSDDVAKTNNGDCDLEIQKIQPKFKIQYRFNPPDDRRQEDIVHEYITHVEPENHYKIGDPLPILYRIDDHYFYDTVRSMPFPIPIGDMDDNDTIVSQSASIEDTSHQKNDVVQVDRSEPTGNDFIDSIPKALENAKDAHQVKLILFILERFHDKKEELLTNDSCTFILPHISRMLQSQRYAYCHAQCIQLLSYIGMHLPVSDKTQPEFGCVTETFNIIKQYIFHQPRTPKNPALDVMNMILSIPDEALKYGRSHFLTDDFYTGIMEMMLDSNVSNDVRIKIITWNWPHASARILDCVIKELEKLNPKDSPEDEVLWNYCRNNLCVAWLKKRYQEEAAIENLASS